MLFNDTNEAKTDADNKIELSKDDAEISDEDRPIATTVRSRRSRIQTTEKSKQTAEESNHGNEEVIYNFGESEPEEENTKDEASDPAEKNKSSLKRRRSSKFWEYVEIDEPEDEFVNEQLTNTPTTTDFSNGNGDDKPLAAVRSSRRSQTQTSEESKQTKVDFFANKHLTPNAQTAGASDDDDEPLAIRSRRSRTQRSEKSKQTEVELFAKKQLITKNNEESEPEEENSKGEAASPEKTKNSLSKRPRSSKFWEYIEIDDPYEEESDRDQFQNLEDRASRRRSQSNPEPLKHKQVLETRTRGAPVQQPALKIKIPENIEEIKDHRGITTTNTSSGTKRKRAVSEVEKNEEENKKTTIKPPAPKMFSPPEKYDWKSNVIESPNGEVKLKINRTLLSESKRFNVNENQFVQRISRRTSTQLGISPDKLLKMQTRSPSPVKKIRGLIGKKPIQNDIYSLLF